MSYIQDPIETYEDRGYTVKLWQDENPENPREWDNLGVMFCWHPRYQLGDEQFTRDAPAEVLDAGEAWDTLEDVRIYLVKHKDAVVILPLVLLDHSGLTIRVGTSYGEDPGGWDTSRVGFVYATREAIKKEYGRVTKATKAKAESVLRQEIATYDQYLKGDVYGYSIEFHGHDVDSCWGFHGLEAVQEAARDTVSRHIDEENRRREEKTRNYIKSCVPIAYRK